MKKIITVLSLCLICSAVTVFYACTDQKLSPSTSNNSPTISTTPDNAAIASVTPFHKGVGGLIDGDLGRKWIANYKSKNRNEMSYTIHSTVVQELLANKACVGISLYYAKAPDGTMHVLPVGVNASGKFIPARKVSTANGDITWDTAMRWIDNYSGTVRAHFSGADIYHTMINAKKCSVLKVSFAMNDNSEPQLLLSNSNETTPPDYADKSFPCPPYCPKD